MTEPQIGDKYDWSDEMPYPHIASISVDANGFITAIHYVANYIKK
jgi:hypothetical protein